MSRGPTVRVAVEADGGGFVRLVVEAPLARLLAAGAAMYAHTRGGVALAAFDVGPRRDEAHAAARVWPEDPGDVARLADVLREGFRRRRAELATLGAVLLLEAMT